MKPDGAAPSGLQVSPALLPPEGRVWVGAVPENLWNQPIADRMQDLDEATGVRHAIFGDFVRFPAVVRDPDTRRTVTGFLAACGAGGVIAMLTVETFDGLESYGREDLEALASFLGGFRLPILLRWNHEFNGGWYPWSRQPARYVERFREAAKLIHAHAPNVAMVWAPNAHGPAYPFPAENVHPLPSPGTADFVALDTNGDGKIDSHDDSYGPYYPGDDSVDWVGISIYSNGINPNDDSSIYWNLPPSAGLFLESVRGLHDRYAVGRRRPMIIAETGAHYHEGDIQRGNASELSIKAAWIDQVYGPEGVGGRSLPGVRAVVWFSQKKSRTDQPGGASAAGDVNVSDERVHANPQVAAAYRRAIEAGPFAQAPEAIRNRVRNGRFLNGLAPWILNTSSGGAAHIAFEAHDTGRLLRFDVEQPGADPWSIQLVQPVTLVQGQRYLLSISSRAHAGGSLSISVIGTAARGWKPYFIASVPPTEGLVAQHFTFEMSEPSDAEARIDLNIGSRPGAVVWVGDVKLTKIP